MSKFLRWFGFFAIYGLLPGALLLLAYLLQPVTAQASAKWIVLLAALLAGGSGFIWAQARFWISPLWKRSPGRSRIAWILTAVVLGFLSFCLLTPGDSLVREKFPLFAQRETLTVQPYALLDGEQVHIQRIKTGQRQVPSSSLSLEGTWQVDDLLLSTSDPAARLVLKAQVPNAVTLVFRRVPNGGQVEILWAGREEIIDLRSEAQDEAVYSFAYDRPGASPAVLAIKIFTLPAWFALAFIASGVFFTSAPGSPSKG